MNWNETMEKMKYNNNKKENIYTKLHGTRDEEKNTQGLRLERAISVYIYAFIVCVLCVYVRMSGIAHGLHALFVFATNKFSMLRRSPASTPLVFDVCVFVFITHILCGLHTVTPNFKFKPTQQQQQQRQIFVYVFASFVLHTMISCVALPAKKKTRLECAFEVPFNLDVSSFLIHLSEFNSILTYFFLLHSDF